MEATEAETEVRMREIIGAGWRAPRTDHDQHNYAALRDAGDAPWIARVGPFWQFAGTHPALSGECVSSVDADGIVLAERLAGLVKDSVDVNETVARETITSEQPVSLEPEPAYAPEHEERADRVAVDGHDRGLADDEREDISGISGDVPNDEFAEGFSGGEPSAATDLVANDQGDAGAFEADALIDADFTDSPLISFEEEMAEAEAQADPGYSGPTFIGLDDLDHKRAVAGYRVRQHAKTLTPFWTTDHNAALGELRNFAMGVTEGRWPDDSARRDELQALEATAARMNEITAARDEKLAFVDEATRKQIEAFDPEAGWPD